MSQDKVAGVVRPAVHAAGLVLENVSVTPAGKRRVVRVVVDLPEDAVGALSLDEIAEVSRAVSDALDAGDALGATPYVLEVTSPGVDRPLAELRHWKRARTRMVSVPVDGVKLVGRLIEVDDAGLTLDVEGTQRRLGWESVGTGRVQVEFNRPGADDDADVDADVAADEDTAADHRDPEHDTEA